MGAERWDEQVGSVADEATRLLESLRRTAEVAAGSAASGSDAEDGPDAGASGPAAGSPRAGAGSGETSGTDQVPDSDAPPHDPFCTWCPLCRGAAVVRSLSPETLTRLADLAGLAATVLADLASSRAAGDPPASGTDPADATTPAPARRAARSRRATPAPSAPIPVRDADDPQEAPRG